MTPRQGKDGEEGKGQDEKAKVGAGGEAPRWPGFFPKASPMLGFSFSCTHRGGARLSVRRRCVGRKEGGRKEGTD